MIPCLLVRDKALDDFRPAMTMEATKDPCDIKVRVESSKLKFWSPTLEAIVRELAQNACDGSTRVVQIA